LETAMAKFEADPAVAQRPILALAELTMRNLLAGGDDVDRRDFLARADTHVAHLIAAKQQPLKIAKRLGHASAAFTQDR
ncbi:MAG TPA: hypothetical protein VLX59_04740, partial [Acidimicrobiales bacterium]|nr:hypothetical protein [Acidimicrobiales bacterium]